MKLSVWAKKQGVTYRTGYNWFKAGNIPNSRQTPTGTILVDEPVDNQKPEGKVAIYTRVSSNQNKNNLHTQADRLSDYARARGWQVVEIVKEVGSGMNDNRRQLEKLLSKENYSIILVEHKDRLTRFGFHYLELLAKEQGKEIHVVNEVEDPHDTLMQDMISIIYSFSAKLYGIRRAKRKTEKIIEELKND